MKRDRPGSKIQEILHKKSSFYAHKDMELIEDLLEKINLDGIF
jgi:hypothetical protein